MAPYPGPPYLMGAMLEDGVDIGRALKVAHGYAEVRKSLNDDQLRKWLMAMLDRLGPLGTYPSTAMAVLAYPSDHIAPHYEQLAYDNGWKENEHAHNAKPE